MVGFLAIVVLLLAYSHGSFVSSVNTEAHKIFGISNAYGTTQAAAAKIGYAAPAFGLNAFGASMLLVPMLMFYLLWPNWGSTLYGEVRGASDFQRVFTGMFSGLWLTVILSVVFLVLYGQDSWMELLQQCQCGLLGRQGLDPDLALSGDDGLVACAQRGVPGHLAARDEPVVLRLGGDVVPILDSGHLRGGFRPGAAGLGRHGFRKAQGPVASLMLMLLPACRPECGVRVLGEVPDLHPRRDLVIAVTYLVSAFAVVILPWRKPELWKASAASKFKLFGFQSCPLPASRRWDW